MAETGNTATVDVAPTQRHRLRDLDRRGRLVAAAFAVALCLAPLVAFLWATPGWAPASDPALMGVRALDVGTSRTPVSGQPSTSGLQADEEILVTHPGPIHFYVMALPVRLLGAAVGMALVSVAITAVCVLIAAWAVFRQLGPPGGIVASVVLGGVMFTTGAATLVNPVSSNIARYPVLCSMVLLWCLICGDNRLLPLAVAVFGFAAQQHLSVLPALGIALVLTAVAVFWLQRHRWRQVAIWPLHRTPVGRALVLGALLWLPVLVQEVFGDRGNLSAMLEFGGSNSRESLGMDSAVEQIVRALGWPPLLGQMRLRGEWLLVSPSAVGWLVAVAMLVAAGVFTWRARSTAPARSRVGLMAVILLVAGLISGSQVPETLERNRLALYHWAWPLSLFVLLAVCLGLYERLRRTSWGARPLVPTALAGVAALLVAVPALVNPSLDRPSNTLEDAYSPLRESEFDALADQIMEHADDLGATIVSERSGDAAAHLFRGLGPGLSLELIERGVDARFSPWYRQVTHEQRHISRDNIDSALILVTDEIFHPFENEVPGELIAEIDRSSIDDEALDALIETASDTDEAVFGSDLDAYLASLPEDRSFLYSMALGSIVEQPRSILLNREFLRILQAYPMVEPALDVDQLARLEASLSERHGELNATLQVYKLDRAEALDYLTSFDLGYPKDDD